MQFLIRVVSFVNEKYVYIYVMICNDKRYITMQEEKQILIYIYSIL